MIPSSWIVGLRLEKGDRMLQASLEKYDKKKAVALKATTFLFFMRKKKRGSKNKIRRHEATGKQTLLNVSTNV
ncbi:MAG: hypothetical protein ASUL_09074 [Candidatus Aramenus sulfurataquae]|uniref:Uncharacterized protein n=1 Tax=Candidatus Aramenus sulfurataquae TaxID=1326980 RepID=W7KTH2_9CREN|nr:MAG: hypothetical protein ASUL_09074 [Candidatus Aramenus sulfurataquae]